MQRSYILGAGILFRAVTTTPMERTHGKERNMSQPDTDTAAQSPSSQQEPQIQTDGRRSHSEQMNQPAQTSQSESSHDGKDEHALHTNLKRGMESRHLQMISLGGVIGTGLFLSSGYTIQQAGPIGTILAAAMMLRYSFDMPAEADEIEAAVNAVLDEGYRTADMMAEGCIKVGCTEMGDKILENI